MTAYALQLRAAMKFAGEHDAVTEHLLADAVEQIEHDVWFLRAQIEQAPPVAAAEPSKRAA